MKLLGTLQAPGKWSFPKSTVLTDGERRRTEVRGSADRGFCEFRLYASGGRNSKSPIGGIELAAAMTNIFRLATAF